jgi:hypothetical protein
MFAPAMLAGHGLIHLIGFLALWRIAQVEGFAYRTTALGGAVQLGEAGAATVGVAWLAIAVGFLVAAVGVWRRSPWAVWLTASLAIASLVVCALGLPETTAGTVVNGGILAAAAWVSFSRGRGAAAVTGGGR